VLVRFAQEEIVGRSKGLASQANEHYRKRMYKSLQSTLVAMREIQEVDPKLDQLQNVLDELEQRIRGDVKVLREEAVSKLKEGREGSWELEGFANKFITLGLVAFEVPTFTAYVLEQMNELLNMASKGVQYVLNLGKFLMQYSDVSGSVDDGTMSRSAAAKRIASEFKQFQNVQNMFWNQAVQKMQKDPKECVKEMEAKQVLDNQNASLDKNDLKKGLRSFWDHYDALLNRSLDGEIQLTDIVNECLQQVSALRRDHNVSGKGTVPDPLRIKDSLPQFLGCIWDRLFSKWAKQIMILPCLVGSEAAGARFCVLQHHSHRERVHVICCRQQVAEQGCRYPGFAWWHQNSSQHSSSGDSPFLRLW